MFQKDGDRFARFTLQVIVFLFALFFLPVIAAQSEQADVGYIVVSLPDQTILDEFANMGLTVDVIKDRDVRQADLDDYQFLFVDDGRVRNTKRINIYDYPTIIMNRYYGEEWGLTDNDGISQQASNSPLQVKMPDGRVRQVYTHAFAQTGGSVALPYYFLHDENKVPMMTLARNYVGSTGYDFGDVVAAAIPGTRLKNGDVTGAKVCFFGLAETDYWTQHARNLFLECVGFVGSVCENDEQCNDFNEFTEDICLNPGSVQAECVHLPIACFTDSDCGTDGYIGGEYCSDDDTGLVRDFQTFTCNEAGTAASFCSDAVAPVEIEACPFGCEAGEAGDQCIAGVHDVALDDSLSNSIGGVRLELRDGTDLVGGATFLCEEKYRVVVKAINAGDFSEDVTFSGQFLDASGVSQLDFAHNAITGFPAKDDSLKTKTVNFTLPEGTYTLRVEAIISGDDVPSNNVVEREVSVLCPTVTCYTDLDCSDEDASTQDICHNPGTLESFCTNEPIACEQDSDCGTDGYITQPFCSNNDVTRTYQEFTCNNAGTATSFCSDTKTDEVIEACQDICSNGACQDITCSTNAECDDQDVTTIDQCVNPGTLQSFCRNDPVNCVSDLDCGVTGFIGSEFCSVNGNIAKNYQEASCMNAGTLESFCDVDVTSRMVQSCNDNNPLTADSCQIFEGSAACIHQEEEITCFADSDCGTDRYRGDLFCSQNDGSVVREFVSYSCIDAGTPASFCREKVNNRVVDACLTNEKCVEVSDGFVPMGVTPVLGAQCIMVQCFADSDCGTDGFIGSEQCNIQGDVEQTYRTYDCVAAGTSLSYCTQNDEQRTVEDCSATQQCSNGQCEDLPIACSTNADCGTDSTSAPYCSSTGDAAQDSTTYTCLQPGTPASSCKQTVTTSVIDDCSAQEMCVSGSCETITCSTDSECGSDGYIDAASCNVDGDVVRTYREYTCNQAGTSSSSCSYDDTTTLIDDCSATQMCTNGQCEDLPVACYTESDCGVDGYVSAAACNVDGDVERTYRDYSCLNAGTPQSACTSEDSKQIIEDCSATQMCTNGQCEDLPVACYTESDCGVDGYITAAACNAQGDVERTYRDYSCLNAGTPASSCSQVDTPQIIDDCSATQMCTNGQCEDLPVACSQDSDCGTDSTSALYCSLDNNIAVDTTTYTCLQPGTPQSSCSVETTTDIIEMCDADEVCEIVNPKGVQVVSQAVCSPIDCSTDSDCGSDGYIDAASCNVDGDVERTYREFTCNQPGTSSSYCSSEDTVELIEDCSATQMCTNGQCEDLPVACSTNADCGEDYQTSLYCSDEDIYYDVVSYDCMEAGTPQSYCTSSTDEIFVSECSGDCEQLSAPVHQAVGAVPLATAQCEEDEPIICSMDSECDDQDPSTVDQCIRPGTPSSYCRNVEVNCVSDLDCGATGFMGEAFCWQNDVHKTYQTAVCQNPGTLQSYCQVSAGPQLVQACMDGNDLTIDRCVEDAGEAFCEYEPIDVDCSRDSDCGTDGYIDQASCNVDGDVERTYREYTCEQPGTATSSCDFTDTVEILEDCSETQMCTNGQCEEVYACSDGIDNDGDLYTDYPQDPGCESPQDDDEQDDVCPQGASEFYGATRLIANSPDFTVNQYDAETESGISPQGEHSPLLDQSGTYLRNGFAVEEGTYYIRIRDHAFSRWTPDNYDTTPWGGDVGLVWESSANVVYNDEGTLVRSKFGRYFFATPDEAITAGKGKGTLLSHSGGNLWVFIDDQPINDNRNFVDVELYSCPDMH